jgi:hypothetical protein
LELTFDFKSIFLKVYSHTRAERAGSDLPTSGEPEVQLRAEMEIFSSHLESFRVNKFRESSLPPGFHMESPGLDPGTPARNPSLGLLRSPGDSHFLPEQKVAIANRHRLPPLARPWRLVRAAQGRCRGYQVLLRKAWKPSALQQAALGTSSTGLGAGESAGSLPVSA